jgi:hypothetical protein
MAYTYVALSKALEWRLHNSVKDTSMHLQNSIISLPTYFSGPLARNIK